MEQVGCLQRRHSSTLVICRQEPLTTDLAFTSDLSVLRCCRCLWIVLGGMIPKCVDTPFQLNLSLDFPTSFCSLSFCSEWFPITEKQLLFCCHCFSCYYMSLQEVCPTLMSLEHFWESQNSYHLSSCDSHQVHRLPRPPDPSNRGLAFRIFYGIPISNEQVFRGLATLRLFGFTLFWHF